MMNQGQPILYNYGNTAPLPPGWVEYQTPTGQPYWYNNITRQSSWVYPVYQPPIPPINNVAAPKKKQIKKKIPGTHWLFVITYDGYEFYYDRETKTSIWEIPEELKEPMELLVKQEEEEKENKKRALQEEQEQEVKRIKLERQKEEEAAKQQEEQPATELTEDDFMWQLQQMEHEEEDQPINEEQTRVVAEEIEEEQPLKEEPPKEKPKVTVDERMTERFYELLKENNISPFSVYSVEYPKLMTDPRFSIVPQHKQKVLFNKYCNELSEKIKNEKKNKKKPEDEFKELLQEKVKEKMYWDDFRRKYKNDSRFKAMPVTKEKEALFKDHVRNLGTHKKSPTEEYKELLSNTKEIRVGMRWRDAKKLLEKDPRYHAIESKIEREDLFRDYLETL